MAKPLTSPVPSSSIARILNAEAVSRAVATAPAPVPAPEARPHPSGDNELPSRPIQTPMITRDIVLTAESDAALGELVAILRRRTGARLNTSVVLRSVLRVIALALPTIDREAAHLTQMRLPSNAPGYEQERHAFEQRLADVILTAITNHGAGPLPGGKER